VSDDLVIVGNNPAGASASVFAARAELSTLVIDADKGFTRRAELNNHLGFPDGITGPDGLVLTTEIRRANRGHRPAGRRRDEDQARQAAGVTTAPGTEPHVNSIVAVDPDGRSSQTGVWAAGTVAGTTMHTVVTAGDGARVAINLISSRKGERWVDDDVLPKPE
jgi:thioredoxin reductase (NADPH)